MAILDNILGVSKQSFLQNRVVPVKSGDKFNNDKCLICWDSYHGHHLGVRILPCNHVFGRDCLQKMVERPYGYECPLCHVALFRPPMQIAVGQFSRKLYERSAVRLLLFQHWLWHMMPDWLGTDMGLLFKLNNPFFWATKAASTFVNFWDRCPHLDLENDTALLTRSHWMPYILFCTAFTLVGDDFESYFEILAFSESCATGIEMVAVIWHLFELIGAFKRRRDWVFFTLITLAAFSLKLGIIYFTYPSLSHLDFGLSHQGLLKSPLISLGDVSSSTRTSYACKMINEHPFVQHSFRAFLGNPGLNAKMEQTCSVVGVSNGQPVWIDCNIAHGALLEALPR
ncbi:hypothetical protein P153DRAFT_358202 [Dothidotthia symphoricarpi CBS 119687]|uniref:RING-type domain-containing protein n=1 Tax=Dothidotthia symphoricarpi CBS 119687 TaxID=1392245 RepID=A0A6A6AB33_9PLEO|nr:uncharacterized protein P153DRAFT_358202 [Dothidotthia symphoricarpi CBS 119687]KAF2128067.1 hypothetical protein P153DRAFT_358202 [Dothidotthia symphoricarpi CBS 119687]